MGVASKSKDVSIRIYNGRTHYNEWQFVYVAQTTAPGQDCGPVASRSAVGRTKGPVGELARRRRTSRGRRRWAGRRPWIVADPVGPSTGGPSGGSRRCRRRTSGQGHEWFPAARAVSRIHNFAIRS